MAKLEQKPPIAQTSKGLTDVLFGELEALTNGESTPQQARATASLAKTICEVTRLEMDHARFVSSVRSSEAGEGLKELKMGSHE